MSDEHIIQLFFNRSEDAIAELSHKYGSTCMSIAQGILGNYHDAEECVNDTYLGVWNTIPPQRPKPLVTYVCRIAKNVAINRWKKEHAQKRFSGYEESLEDWENALTSKECVEDSVLTEELSNMITAFLHTTSCENRILFVRKYWYQDSYEMLSLSTGLSEQTIRTRLSRLRKELRDYLKNGGVVL